MTTVATRVRQISNKEGFDIQVLSRNRRPVRVTLNGRLGPWPHTRKSKGAMTVAEFKEKFGRTYPGYHCSVLTADGHMARGNTLLDSVRRSYTE